MAELFQCSQIDAYVNKYSFELDKYHLSSTIQEQKDLDTTKQGLDNLEPLKDCGVHIIPSFCVWQFMSENEVIEIQKVKKLPALKKIIGKLLFNSRQLLVLYSTTLYDFVRSKIRQYNTTRNTSNSFQRTCFKHHQIFAQIFFRYATNRSNTIDIL